MVWHCNSHDSDRARSIERAGSVSFFEVCTNVIINAEEQRY